MSKFVHLHTHSHYSLLEALPKIPNMLDHVKDMGMSSLALTDNGTMYGIIEFYQKALSKDIKPIIGVDFYVAKDGRHQKRARIDTKPHRLVCLAKNNVGYDNLMQMSSVGFLEGFYYKPRIDKEVLKQYSDGIIVLSGGYNGEIGEHLRWERTKEATELIEEYVKIFGEGNFFLELVDRPEIAEQESINAQAIQLGKKLGVPLVATKNTYYIEPTDVEAWKILNCIKGGKTLEHFNRLNQYDFDASMVSSEYMESRFSDVPEAIENTQKIAEQCNVELALGKWNFPKYEIPKNKTFLDMLRELAYRALEEKEGVLTDLMKERLEYELEIIENKGFCPYFLIVSDFISWARNQGIMTTTRGSAAGSLVGYSVGISAINPLVYELPFERFLNPERPSAPDVDADFADNRRDEVLEYVRERYGREKVAQICTFGTMLARGSIRDVGRGLGFEYSMVDKIAKLVPMGSQGFPMTLDRALDESPDLKSLYDTDVNSHRVIDLAKRIEGCGRHVSIHAAGAVISPVELTKYTPLQIDTREGKMITQYEMKSVEAAGLVKMDFLGIRNLSILGDAIHLVKKTKGVDIDIEKIPVDDNKTFTLLAGGHTMGVFQLGGEGMTKYLMELKPSVIEDIMAMVALYRPGPIESIPEYIRRKHDQSLVSFLDPRMRTILNKSHGVIVYQDDVMLIAIHLAGYSWLEADKLRKAMGKKIPAEMMKQKKKLLDGFIKNGLSEKLSMKLWKLIEPFAAYGFNKAHACSYGMVAYQTAFMKANYPAEYMTSLMTNESGDLEKVALAVSECERMGINVLSPDINMSLKDFTYINDNEIRFGLVVIKGLGDEVVASIISERKENGKFKNLSDFSERVSHRAFNKKSLEALIKAGALDCFGDRKKLIESLDRILMYNKSKQKERLLNQQSLFSVSSSAISDGIVLREVESATMQEILGWEKEILGLYVSGHPYDEMDKLFSKYLVSCAEIAQYQDGKHVKCGGVITSVKEILTKKGDAMAFVGLEDMSGQTEIIVFPKSYESLKEYLIEDSIVLVSARVSKRADEEGKLIANTFITISNGSEFEVQKMLSEGMWVPGYTKSEETDTGYNENVSGDVVLNQGSLLITLKGKPTPDMVSALRNIFRASPGSKSVCLIVESGGHMRKIETEYMVSVSDDMVDNVASIVGRQNVSVS